MESHRQRVGGHIARVLTGCLTVASLLVTIPAVAQIISAPFDANYTLADLGSVPGLPPRYGGLTFQTGDPSTLLIGGEANTQSGVPVATEQKV